MVTAIKQNTTKCNKCSNVLAFDNNDVKEINQCGWEEYIIMKYRNDLKIEFKAESFGSTSSFHVLMYRISPNQDLTYTEERSFLGFKYKVKKKFDTSWHEAYQYFNYPRASEYDKPQTSPILMSKREEFEEWKQCKTMGEFFARLNKINEKEINEWKQDREKYIDKCKTWV